MLRWITLTDGTQYEADWCNGDKGVLFMNLITDASFMELVQKFSDLSLIAPIIYHISQDNEKAFEGYTRLKSINFDDWRTGTVMVTLTEPEKA